MFSTTKNDFAEATTTSFQSCSPRAIAKGFIAAMREETAPLSHFLRVEVLTPVFCKFFLSAKKNSALRAEKKTQQKTKISSKNIFLFHPKSAKNKSCRLRRPRRQQKILKTQKCSALYFLLIFFFAKKNGGSNSQERASSRLFPIKCAY